MKYIKGDLIELAKKGEFDIIVHGCNCFNTMGAGIAKLIKDEFPMAYQVDLKTVKGDKKKLGNYSTYEYTINKKKLRIINAYTQYNFGFSKSNPPIDYEAVKAAFNKINSRYPNKRVGIPQIGAGLAGGDWNKIEKIIDQESKNLDLVCVIYSK